MEEALDESEINNTWLDPIYEMCINLFGSVMPITATLLSMLYLLTHQRNIMEREIEQQTSNLSHPSTIITKDNFQLMLEFEECLVEFTEDDDQLVSAEANEDD